jgi:hypothetical protein
MAGREITTINHMTGGGIRISRRGTSWHFQNQSELAEHYAAKLSEAEDAYESLAKAQSTLSSLCDRIRSLLKNDDNKDEILAAIAKAQDIPF